MTSKERIKNEKSEEDIIRLRTLMFEFKSTIDYFPSIKKDIENIINTTNDVNHNYLVSKIEGQLDKLASFSIDIYSLADEVTKIDEVNSFIEIAHEKMTLRTINKVQEKLNLIINKNKIEKKVKDKLSNIGYIDNGDETITSEKYGVMWMKYTLGLSEKKCYMPSSKFFSGSEVLKQATLLNNSGGFAGYQDWYLPSIEQLKTLIRPNEKPAICQEAFPWFSLNSGEYICSSTLLKESENEDYKGSAINFSEGIVKNVVGGSIRLVRKL